MAPSKPIARTSSITTISRTRSTRSFSIPRWSTAAAISPIRHNDLAAAQRDKLDMICRKLRLKSGETLLDIGCGWGGLICHAARHYGVRALSASTLAKEQYDYAKAKIERLGLGRTGSHLNSATIPRSKARSTRSRRSACSSTSASRIIRLYYQTVHRLLQAARALSASHHRAARTARTKRRREETAYKALGRYIFPGGELDHLGMSIENLERYGFEVHDVEGWREHYAKTLRHWHDRLKANEAAAEREVGVMKTRLWLSLFRRRVDRLRARRARHQPDARFEARTRRVGTAADARGSVSMMPAQSTKEPGTVRIRLPGWKSA